MTDSDFINLRNSRAECRISLFGGNLLSYRPAGEEHDVFWLGDRNKFDGLQAIRGGIPVCWLRFAEEKLNDNLPRHGFARLSDWQLKKVSVDEDKIEVRLSLIPDAKYNLSLSANLFIKITDKLEYTLETINNGDNEFDFSEALHAYFKISSVKNVEIKGVAGHQYKNSLDGRFYQQNNNLKICGEVDSIFMNQTQPLEIVDKGYNRVILIEKTNSNTTVIWNPAKDLAEMSPEQYKTFVCVEPSNVGESFVRLKPHEKHKISMTVQVKKL